MLLTAIQTPIADRDILATQLTGALDGPFLLILHFEELGDELERAGQRLKTGWTQLITTICENSTPN